MHGNNVNEHAIVGSLIGTAVGDSIGLPFEGLSKKRQIKLYPDVSRHHFLFGRGMISDDTEHACLTAEAIIIATIGENEFLNALSQKLKIWLSDLPAGVGLATLKAVLKLWLGFPPERCGVFSAGNGPAMRSPIIGVCFGSNSDMLHRFVQASTQLTHTDPKAKFGALAVALAAYMAGAYKEEIAPDSYYEALSKLLNRESSEAVEFLRLMEQVADSVSRDGTTETFAEMQGLRNGISGYMYHTVPAAIHAWLANQNDFKSGITEIIRCGGDTDTTAAILGGIIGAHVGKEGIPAQWIDGIKEWPRTVWWIERLGKELAYVLSNGIRRYDLSLPWYGISLRNVFFLIIVLAHGFRRLLPPY